MWDRCYEPLADGENDGGARIAWRKKAAQPPSLARTMVEVSLAALRRSILDGDAAAGRRPRLSYEARAVRLAALIFTLPLPPPRGAGDQRNVDGVRGSGEAMEGSAEKREALDRQRARLLWRLRRVLEDNADDEDIDEGDESDEDYGDGTACSTANHRDDADRLRLRLRRRERRQHAWRRCWPGWHGALAFCLTVGCVESSYLGDAGASGEVAKSMPPPSAWNARRRASTSSASDVVSAGHVGSASAGVHAKGQREEGDGDIDGGDNAELPSRAHTPRDSATICGILRCRQPHVAETVPEDDSAAIGLFFREEMKRLLMTAGRPQKMSSSMTTASCVFAWMMLCKQAGRVLRR